MGIGKQQTMDVVSWNVLQVNEMLGTTDYTDCTCRRWMNGWSHQNDASVYVDSSKSVTFIIVR